MNTQTTGSQSRPTVTGLPDGGFVVSWQDGSGTLGDASSNSIKAQIFSVESFMVTLQNGNGDVVGTFGTIQEAVNAAQSGYTLILDAGDFDATASTIVIDKSLTIQGANAGVSGSDTRGDESVITADADTKMFSFVNGASVTFDGVKLVGDALFDSGVSGQSITITNSVLETAGTHNNVIYMGYQPDYSFSFTNNAVSASGGSDFIDAFGRGTITVTDNTFTGTDGYFNPANGVDRPLFLNTGAAGTVSDNSFPGAAIGVLVADAAGPLTISGNDFADLHRDPGQGLAAGVVFYSPDPYTGTVSVTGNQFTDADAGIRTSGVPGSTLAGSSITIHGNDFDDVGTPVYQHDFIPGTLHATDSTVDDAPVADLYAGDTVAIAADLAAASFSYDSTAQRWSVTHDGTTETLGTVSTVVDSNGQVFSLVGGAGAYASIQSAVDAANANGTILIASGTYTESKTTIHGASGLYINTAGLTLQGFDASGQIITDAETARTAGPVVISGAENNFGANHWIDADGDGVTIAGLHLQAGAETTNKLLEIWGDAATITDNFVDTFIGGDSAAPSWAAAIYLNEVAGQPINSYAIDGNVLNEAIYVANGVGDGASGDIATAQTITGNRFETAGFDAADPNTLGRYDMVAVQGRIPGLGYQDDPAQVPTISGNTRSDNSAPFIFRMTEEDAAKFPTLAEIRALVAANTDADTTYAFVVDADTGEAKIVPGTSGGAEIYRQFVTNGIDTLNALLDSTPDGVSGSAARPVIETGDTLIVQSGSGAVDSAILVDNLKVQATANSVDLDLTLATTLADGTPIAGGGVHGITLLDYAVGQGAAVDVTGNDLANTITGNSAANLLSGGGGDDVLVGGAGNDTLDGGTGNDTLIGGAGSDIATYAAGATIVETATGWTVTHDGATDTLSGVESVTIGGTTYRLVDHFGASGGGFQTVQAAIDAAGTGDIVLVAAGDYAENLLITTAGVTLQGSAGRDSIIRTATTDLADGNVITVRADDTTIKGFTITGENNALGGGVAMADGVVTHVARLISNYQDSRGGGASIDRLMVLDNDLSHANRFAITNYNDGAASSGPSSGSLVQDNYIHDLAGYRAGTTTLRSGVFIGPESYTDVVHNTIEDVGEGISTVSLGLGDLDGTPLRIIDNTISAQRGIFINNHYTAASHTILSGNTVTLAEHPTNANTAEGIRIWSFVNGGTVEVTDNDVSGFAYGYRLANNPGGITINGGTLSGNQIGVELYDSYGFGLVPGENQVTLAGVNITGSTVANVRISDSTTDTQATTTSGTTLAVIFDAANPPVLGSAPADVILNGDTARFDANGFDGALTIRGNGTDNELTGGDGGDTLTGGGGNDALVGGAGSDTAVFTGNYGDYTISLANGVYTVADETANRDGTDTVSGVEFFRFANGTLAAGNVLNVAPTNLTVNTSAVTENAAAGTVVGSASATDANTLDQVTYSLSDNAGGRFAINASTGVITVANGAVIDREQAASYGITVVATDTGGLSTSRAVAIAVTDVDEFNVTAPTDANAAANSVAEGAATGTLVGITARAVDGDATTNAVTYALTDNAGGRFQINATTGVVSVLNGQLIDYETAPGNAYQITVRATSADGSVNASNFAIAVENAAETQVFIGTNAAETRDLVTDDNWTVDAKGGADVITTHGGNDTYVAGLGDDTYFLGGGNDIVTFKGAAGANGYDAIVGGDGVDELRALAANTAISLRSVSGVELVNGNGFANVTVVGSSKDDALDFSGATMVGIASIKAGAGNDVVHGSVSNDTIQGDAGNDMLFGEGGDDTFLVGLSAGIDSFNGGAGIDRVVVTANNVKLGIASLTDVEFIDATGRTGTVLVGTGGNDTLDFHGAQIIGTIAIDAGAGNDTVIGSDSGDIIKAGLGSDVLTGGLGNDRFVFEKTLDSRTGGAFDRILDFTSGQDQIDLSVIDANTKVSGNNAFTLLSENAAFTRVAGQLRVDTTLAGVTKVFGDINGDGVADFEIQLTDTHHLTASDFIL